MFITQQGKMLRTSAGAISLIGRNTQGVRLIEMDEGDRAVSLARLDEQESDLADQDGSEPAPMENPEGPDGT
jgi:DNA gyrase subunit A